MLAEDFLEHYGVLGMKWGVRRDRTDGVSRRTDNEARKDAKEFARAKMYYGEGAGTRRKLIRESVNAKSKRDESYARAFERHFSREDLSSHASGARRERSRTDRKKTARQGAGYVARRLTGEMGTTAAFVAAAGAGAVFLNSPRGREVMRSGSGQVRNLINEGKRRVNAHNLRRMM